jgi:hypothetical protein
VLWPPSLLTPGLAKNHKPSLLIDFLFNRDSAVGNSVERSAETVRMPMFGT